MAGKVLHIITRLIHGGADQNTLQTCLGLQKRNWEVILVIGRDVTLDLDTLQDAGVKVERIDSLVRNISPLKDMKALYNFYRLCKKYRPDLVHTHTAKAGVVGRLAAKLVGIRFVVHGVHGSPLDSIEIPWKRKLLAFIEGKTAFLNDYYITVGEEIFEKYCRQIGSVRPENYQVARSAFDVGAFTNAKQHREIKRHEYGLTNEHVAVGMIGRLTPQKGYENYLQVVRKLAAKKPEMRFFAAGSTDLKEYYQHIYKQGKDLVQSGSLVFLGQLPYQEVPPFIAAMDLMIHTARWEGLPRAVVESLVSNKPVISFNVEGVTEVIEDGVNGFIISEENIDEMVEKVLLASEKIDQTDFLKNAGVLNECLRKEFLPETMVDNLEKVYNQLLGITH